VAVLRGSVGTSYVNSRCPAWQIVVVERSVLTEINEDVMLYLVRQSMDSYIIALLYRTPSPVAVRTGASLLGRWLLPRVRQHSALSAVSWRSNLRGAANTQQLRVLRRQNFYSHWTSLVELSSGPAAQSKHHVRTVQTTAEATSFSRSMNTALCDFWYAAP